MHKASERWIDHSIFATAGTSRGNPVVNPAIHLVLLLLSPTRAARDACTAQIACLLSVGSCILETSPRQHATTVVTYRDTASAQTAASVHTNVPMSSRVHALNGCNIPPPPLLCSLTGSGLRSLFLAMAIFTGGHSWAAPTR
ncbi:hypothetical protein DE146DRAFT_19734 [Phaeosphaeria sp. MPI-PUGE-AT-0046c]|nr:hypothetical protein DE146DRAFT_19734 [Phaeosphaeria sp. MPI-PUGE-AT-0046c]